jgi:hypothetical protein
MRSSPSGRANSRRCWRDRPIHEIAQYPALGALLGVLWKILQDEIRDQRDIKKAATLALNSLFAGSHYASRVYDKQVEFCEGYWRLVLEIIKEMEREAESPTLVQKANALYTYRMERAIWVSEDMTLDLEGFEKALRSVGALSHSLQALAVGPERSERVDRVMRAFEEIMHIRDTKTGGEKAPSYVEVLVKLQAVLGIATAYAWRQEFMERAADR